MKSKKEHQVVEEDQQDQKEEKPLQSSNFVPVQSLRESSAATTRNQAVEEDHQDQEVEELRQIQTLTRCSSGESSGEGELRSTAGSLPRRAGLKRSRCIEARSRRPSRRARRIASQSFVDDEEVDQDEQDEEEGLDCKQVGGSRSG